MLTAKAAQAGYLASIQFLEQRQDLKGFPAVGYWVWCAARISGGGHVRNVNLPQSHFISG